MLATDKRERKLDSCKISDVERVLTCLNSPITERIEGAAAANRLGERLTALKRRSKLFEQVSLSKQVQAILACTNAD
jgi:hypothetical protein